MNPACRCTTPKREGEREYGSGGWVGVDAETGERTGGLFSFSVHAPSTSTESATAQPEIEEELFNPRRLNPGCPGECCRGQRP